MKIKINEPCDADWSKMKIGIKSRHCELCVKNVMDFTQMTSQEIIEYLFKNQNQSTCGRMVGGQIDFKLADFEAVIEGNRRKQGNHPFLVLSFAALAMMSCGTNADDSSFDPVLGEMIVAPQFDSIDETRLDGMVASPTMMDTSQNEVDTTDKDKLGVTQFKKGKIQDCLSKSGEVNIETGKAIPGKVEVITGDVKTFPETEIEGMVELIPDPDPTVDGLIEIVETHTAGPVPMLFSNPEINFPDGVIPPIVFDSVVILDVAEKMPEYPEGVDSLLNYLVNEINYPKKAQKAGIEGRVYVQFVVDKTGEISGATVLKGISKECNEEALRVINSMPNWIPGENKGKKVAVKYTLPIKFVLQ